MTRGVDGAAGLGIGQSWFALLQAICGVEDDETVLAGQRDNQILVVLCRYTTSVVYSVTEIFDGG